MFADGPSHAAHLMLKAAADGETEKVIDFIQQKGVFITTKNNFGVSALIFAANNGHLALVKELVEIGADIEDRSNNWRTPLIWASLWGHNEVVKYLLDIGANVSAFDTEGMTALLSAVKNGHEQSVRYLLEYGANATAINFFNGTALSIAKNRADHKLVNLLKPYFPPEPERSPYKIAAQILYREMTTLIRVFMEESANYYSQALEWYQLICDTTHSTWREMVKEAIKAERAESISDKESINTCSSTEIDEHIVDSSMIEVGYVAKPRITSEHIANTNEESFGDIRKVYSTEL